MRQSRSVWTGFQYAANTMWGVPRNNRPNPIKARGRSLVLLATAGLAVLGTTALSVVGGGGAGTLGEAGRYLVLALVDRLRVTVFLLILGPAGREPIYAGWPQTGLELTSTTVLDARIVTLEYRPARRAAG